MKFENFKSKEKIFKFFREGRNTSRTKERNGNAAESGRWQALKQCLETPEEEGL